MKIVSHVAVDFYDKNRNLIFSVPAHLIDHFLTAPDEIQEDIIFGMLLKDRSLEVFETPAQKKALENDPTAGVNAEGKKTKPDRKAAGKDTAEDAASSDGKSGTVSTAKSTAAGKES